MLQYSTINHIARKKYRLSILECCILDSIGKLSNQPRYEYCTISKQDLATFIGCTERYLFTVFARLKELWLIEINEKWKTKATQVYYDEFIMISQDELSSPSPWTEFMKKTKKHELSSPNKDIYIKNIIDTLSFFSEDVKKEFTRYILDRVKKREKITDDTIKVAYDTLHRHWKTSQDQLQIISNSIQSGRKGLFPLKISKQKGTSPGIYEDKSYDAPKWVEVLHIPT